MLHQRIVEMRKKRHKTQEALAKQIGVTRSALSQYELGSRQPDYETIKRMADYFEVSTDYLLGKEVTSGSFLTDPQKIKLFELIDELDEDDKNYVMETIKRITKK